MRIMVKFTVSLGASELILVAAIFFIIFGITVDDLLVLSPIVVLLAEAVFVHRCILILDLRLLPLAHFLDDVSLLSAWFSRRFTFGLHIFLFIYKR